MATEGGRISRRKGIENGQETIEDVYLVKVEADNDIDGAKAFVQGVAPPAGYSRRSTMAQHVNRNPHWFEVTASYKENSYSGGQGSENPLSRPSVLSGSYEEWTDEYFIDRSSTPKLAVNTAGDRMEPMPQRKHGSLVLNVTKNFATYNAVTYDNLKFTTNSSSVQIKGTTYATDVLLFLPPSVQEVYEQVGEVEYHYFAITFRLAADAGKHRDLVPSRGYKQLVDGKLVQILDANGQPVETPWPLNENGTAKAAGEAPHTLEFQPYASASWGIDFN